jgi:hypothetical protein
VQPAPAALGAESALAPAAAHTAVAAAPRIDKAPVSAPEPVRVEALADDADHSGEEADEPSTPSGNMADEGGQGIARKHRGIRLKQHLN